MRKQGSTLQQLSVSVTVPTDIEFEQDSIGTVTFVISEAEPPYRTVVADVISSYTLAGEVGAQTISFDWQEPAVDSPLEDREYVGEVRIEAAEGSRVLVAPSDGYIPIDMTTPLRTEVEAES